MRKHPIEGECFFENMLIVEISAFVGSYMFLLKVFVVARQELFLGCFMLQYIYIYIQLMHSIINFKILEVWGPIAPVYFNLPLGWL